MADQGETKTSGTFAQNRTGEALAPGEPPWVDAYQIHEWAPEIRPGRRERQWMDEIDDRFAYRCLPLTMANSTGWEILCPAPIEVTWNGGPRNEDMVLRVLADWPEPENIGGSHFTSGILTFHTGYLFRTPPGWAIWCGGPPNWPKDRICPLEGLIETEWLPFPFTMNWKFTRPGRVRFEKDEPFCFFTLVEHGRVEAARPRRLSLSETTDLQDEYEAWAQSREDFNARLEAQEPEAMKEAWQRHYMRGVKPSGEKMDGHVTKRRLTGFGDLNSKKTDL